MSLSQYNYSDHKLSYEMGNKIIKFRPWTTKDEREYLMFVNDTNKDGTRVTKDDEENQIFELLLKPCLKEPETILTLDEKRILLVEMRKISLGDSLNFPVECSNPDCKSVNHFEVELDEIAQFKPFTPIDINVEDITITFGEIKTENLLKRVQDSKNDVERNFNDLLVHIISIKILGKDIPFNFDELKKFIDDLPVNMSDKIFKGYKDMKSTFTLNNITRNCAICGEETYLIFSEGIPDFLWGL